MADGLSSEPPPGRRRPPRPRACAPRRSSATSPAARSSWRAWARSATGSSTSPSATCTRARARRARARADHRRRARRRSAAASPSSPRTSVRCARSRYPGSRSRRRSSRRRRTRACRARSTRSRCCERNRRRARREGGAVRGSGRRAAHLGALDGDVVHDAGPPAPARLRPLGRGLGARSPRPTARRGRSPSCGCCTPSCPSKILGIGAQLPRARRRVRARRPRRAGRVREVPVVARRPRRADRDPARGDAARLGGRGRGRDRPAHLPRRPRQRARAAIGGISAINDVSGRRAQLETPLRQFTLGKSFDTFAPMGPAIASIEDVDLDDIDVRTTVSGELMQDAQHARSDLLDRRPDRLPLGRASRSSRAT